MHQRTTTRKRLAVESLEARWLMAGDVTANVVGGNLFVTGDDLDNRIAITQLAPGDYEISGIDADTTINGQAVGTPAVVHGVNKNVSISLGEANDEVVLRHMNVPRELAIRTGAGNDNVWLGGVRVGRDLHIDTGVGSDGVHVGSFGPQPVANPPQPGGPPNGPLPGLAVEGNAFIRTGDDYDHVVIEQARVKGNLAIDTGQGGDRVTLGYVPVYTQAVAGEPAPEGPVPEGQPQFKVVVGRTLSIMTGAGNDAVNLERVKAKMAILNTGDGNDEIAVRGSMADYVFALMGQGDDTFNALGNNTVLGHFLLLGGPGADKLINGPNNVVGTSHIHGVETTI